MDQGLLNAFARGRTPLLALDLVELDRALTTFESAFPSAELKFPVKCCPSPFILHRLIKAGTGFDVASVGETRRVLDLGADVDGLLYTDPAPSPDEVAELGGLGVRWFVVDHVDGARVIDRHVEEPSLLVRVRPSSSGGPYDYGDRLGCEVDDAAKIASVTEVRGVCFHVGSQTEDPTVFSRAIREVAPLFATSSGLNVLDIGGGFPVGYPGRDAADLEDFATAIAAELRRLRGVRLIVEPGRSLVASVGRLITAVRAIRQRPRTRWVHVDASVYGGLIEVLESRGQIRPALPSYTEPTETADVCGPTVDPDDVIARDVQLPSNLAVGDLISLELAGAYTVGLATTFHDRPIPRIVAFDGHDSVRPAPSTISGLGMFAHKAFGRDEIVFEITGYPTTQRSATSFELPEGHIEPTANGALLNHSCRPNAFVDVTSGAALVRAATLVSKGEEITIDYRRTERELANPFTCGCPSCGHTDIK